MATSVLSMTKVKNSGQPSYHNGKDTAFIVRASLATYKCGHAAIERLPKHES